MVNPLARKNMKRYLKDDDKDYSYESSNTYNLDSNESVLIQKIIQGNGKSSSKTITLDEAVQRMKNGR